MNIAISKITTLLLLLLFAMSAEASPLQVCATVPDLADITAVVGGAEVEVESFAKGPQDPHFLEAKPSFVKRLSQADLLVQVGMELEVGWLPLLLQNSRNQKVQPGATGNFDASIVISPLEVPGGTVDRSMGDVHVRGNPHFLTDPLNGIAVAESLAERLGVLRPEKKNYFFKQLGVFKQQIGEALWGGPLVSEIGVDKLVVLTRSNGLMRFLKSSGQEAKLEGWLGKLGMYPGRKAVADHNIWPYLAERTGIVVEDFLEPKPGIAPTTSHLKQVIDKMNAENIRIILTTTYYDPRHAEFTAEATGAQIVQIAHQDGAVPDAQGYLGTVNYNFRVLTEALKRAKG